jgi:hypothetical protein
MNSYTVGHEETDIDVTKLQTVQHPAVLDDEQQRRAEALKIARVILMSNQPFNANVSAWEVSDLVTLAVFILDGSEWYHIDESDDRIGVIDDIEDDDQAAE